MLDQLRRSQEVGLGRHLDLIAIRPQRPQERRLGRRTYRLLDEIRRIGNHEAGTIRRPGAN
jgi:hypothetical protein